MKTSLIFILGSLIAPLVTAGPMAVTLTKLEPLIQHIESTKPVTPAPVAPATPKPAALRLTAREAFYVGYAEAAILARSAERKGDAKLASYWWSYAENELLVMYELQQSGVDIDAVPTS